MAAHHVRPLRVLKPSFTSRVIVYHLQQALPCQAISWPLGISFHIPYHLRLPMEAVALMEEHQVGTNDVAVCSRNHHFAHEPRSVLAVLFAEDTVSRAILTSRTASVVEGNGHQQVHVLLHSRTRLQLMQVFHLTEKRITDEAVLSRGFF